MQRYFALLRGINVGGHRIKMDRLRKLVEALGFEQVETFIASGNVIFSSPRRPVTFFPRTSGSLVGSSIHLASPPAQAHCEEPELLLARPRGLLKKQASRSTRVSNKIDVIRTTPPCPAGGPTQEEAARNGR